MYNCLTTVVLTVNDNFYQSSSYSRRRRHTKAALLIQFNEDLDYKLFQYRERKSERESKREKKEVYPPSLPV